MQTISSRFKFISGFVIASLIFGVGAVAVNVNNTPEGGYLLCANKKTRAVTFPGTLKCPSGTVEIQIPGNNGSSTFPETNSQNSSNSGSTNTMNTSKGNVNCNLNYLLSNPNQVGNVISQCSSQQLTTLQRDLTENQSKLDTDLAKARAANNATLVADIIAKQKNSIQILTALVNEIAKKVKG